MAGESIPARLLQKLARWICQRPGWFIYPQILLVGLAVFYTVKNLGFSMDRNDLVGSEKRYHQIFLEYKRDFQVRDDLVAVVESGDPEKNRQFVERLAHRMQQEPGLFVDIFHKGDLTLMGSKALLLLDEEALQQLAKSLKDYRPLLDSLSTTTDLDSLFQFINNRFRQASRETNAANDTLIKALPALRGILDQGTESLRRSGIPPSPGMGALFNAGPEAERAQYITFADGQIYLVSAKPASDDLAPRAVARLRELVAATNAEVPGVNAGVTGEDVLEFDEMRQSQMDSTKASVISLVLCALLFVAGYSEFKRPMKAMATLALGLGYTMAYTTLAVGHLNILTITFFPILIGLTIDFGVHLISRHEEELAAGKPKEEALRLAMVMTGQGVFTGCFTTAGAFFAMAFTDFKGIEEMGIITGGGMLVCLLPMMTFLPAWLALENPNVAPSHSGFGRWRHGVENLWLRRPKTVVLLGVAATLAAIVPARRVYFDYNLLNMQSQGLPSVLFEHKLIDSASKSLLYGVVVVPDAAAAVALERQLTNLSTVASVDSIGRFFIGDPARKLEEIRQIKQSLSGLEFERPDAGPANIDDLSRTLWSLQGYLGLALNQVSKGEHPELWKEMTLLRASLQAFRSVLNNGKPEVVAARVGKYQRALLEDLSRTFASLQSQDASSGLSAEDLPDAIRNRFVGAGGRQILQVYPKSNVWQRAEQEAFVKELRTAAPSLTGTPVQLFEYTTLLKESYQEAAYYSLGAITLLVLLHFRRLGAVVLSLLPVAMGALLSLGVMGLLDIPFNPANIMTLPLVVGIGVTNGVHILNRFAEERRASILANSTGKAVLVSGLTTISGFGSLILADHQGISSLGLVMSLGVGFCMLVALTFLPALMSLRGEGDKKRT